MSEKGRIAWPDLTPSEGFCVFKAIRRVNAVTKLNDNIHDHYSITVDSIESYRDELGYRAHSGQEST